MNVETYFPYKLASTAEAFSRCLSDVYARTYGLSREEWRVLFLLADAGELTSRDLAQRSTLDKVQVSRATTRLETKALIRRRITTSDRRLRTYACTDAGQDLFDRAFPDVQAQANAILDRLSKKDREHLEKGLQALRTATHAFRAEAGSRTGL